MGRFPEELVGRIFLLLVLVLPACVGNRTGLNVARNDGGIADAPIDVAPDRAADLARDVAVESGRDSSVDSRPETPPVDVRADLPRESAGDMAQVARDLSQDQPRELATREAGADSLNEVQTVDPALRETAGDALSDAKPDSPSGQDATGGSNACVGSLAACNGDIVNLSISSLHCGACECPCDPGNVCSDGMCQPATSDWPTLQHDLQHSGQNPDETGVPPLCLLWSVAVEPGTPLSPVVVENGRLFVAPAARSGKTSTVRALHVSDGSAIWQYDFGALFSVGYPSVFSGSVYIANGRLDDLSGPPLLWAMGATTGEPQWSAKLLAQWEMYWPPIRVGDTVYTNGGTYGGMYGISAADGAEVCFLRGLAQYDQWSPAYSGDNVFTYMGGELCKHDPATGAILATVTVPFTWNGWSMKAVPAFAPNRAYIIGPGKLSAVDTSRDSIAWTADGFFAGTPAVAGGTVYGYSSGGLVALSAETGTVLWTFGGDFALSFPPVVVGEYVYVASARNVYAVDVASHAQVWTDSVGGWLSVAAHKLFIASADGTLRAYQLSSR